MRRGWRGVPLVAGLLALLASLASASALDGQSRPGASDPVLTFWSSLGAPELEELLAEALAGNLELEAVRHRVGRARADRTGAMLDLAPSVTADAGYSRQRLAGVAVPGGPGRLPDQALWEAGVQASWELDISGRVRRSLDGRTSLVNSAQQDVAAVEVLVAAELAGAWFLLRGAQDRMGVARRNAANQERTLQITVERLEGGRGTALDTERARAQLSSTRAAIPALEAEIQRQSHRIAVLTGRDPDGAWGLSGAGGSDETGIPTLPAPRGPGASGELDAIVEARPDVRSAEDAFEARAAFLEGARTAYLPRVSVGGVAGYTAAAFDALGDRGTPRYALGLNVSWPLFDLGRVRAGVDGARADEREAASIHRQRRLAARQELESAGVTYTRALERLGHLEDAASAGERAAHLARLRFEEGGSDFLEVLDAERTVLEAQDRLAGARIEAAAALVELFRASGGRAAP